MASNNENLHGAAGLPSGALHCTARMRRAPSAIRSWLIVLLLAAALALASCGSSDDPSPVPEIEIRDSSGALILATTTFDFGGPISQGSPVTETFTIDNLGDGALTINGTPAIGGADFTFYTVSVPPGASVPAGGSTTFGVLFPNAMAFGTTKNATVTVSSNDSDEGSFTFGVTGIATS